MVNYSFATFKKDLFAALTVAVISLPLSMGLSIASGSTPEKGIFTAIIAGLCVSLFGGSKVQVAGPTGTFAIIVFTTLQTGGYTALIATTLIAAVILVLFGLMRLGNFIQYVPQSLISGFTVGISMQLLSSQLKDFFGLPMLLPVRFLDRCVAYYENYSAFDMPTTVLSLSVVALIGLIRAFSAKIPWAIVSIIVSMIFAYATDYPVATIASKFGAMPDRFPTPAWPDLEHLTMHYPQYLIGGFMIAFLGGIETLLSAAVADRLSGHKHNSNRELIGLGITNFAAALFGSVPAAGTLSRTAANVKNGAQTRAAGALQALIMLFIIYFLAPIASKIPLSALSAIVVVIAVKITYSANFFHYMRSSFEERSIFLTAMLLTAMVNAASAIAAGMALSLLFARRKKLEEDL